MRLGVVHCLVAFLVILCGCGALAGRDFYRILGVSRGATEREIKKAYKRLAKEHHPDIHKNNAESTKKFRDISEAYETLHDAEKRRDYDAGGEEMVGRGGGGGGGRGGGFHNPIDIFAQFFGGGHAHGHADDAEKRGPEMHVDVHIGLEENFAGTAISYLLTKNGICQVCEGSGAENKNDVQRCPLCDGHGVRIVRQEVFPGMFAQGQAVCDACSGKGKIIRSTCPQCKGKKLHPISTPINVIVSPGTPESYEIVEEEEAEESPDWVPGDVIFRVKTLPHHKFMRKENDLYIQETISLSQALLGFERQVKHLDGKNITVARSEVTPPGLVQKLSGEGMPVLHKGVRGDLYVNYTVAFPERISAAQREVIAAHFGEDPKSDFKDEL